MAGYGDGGSAGNAVIVGRPMKKKLLNELLDFAVDHVFIKVNNSPIVIEAIEYGGYFTDHYISTETIIVCDVCKKETELVEGMSMATLLRFLTTHQDCERKAFPRYRK